MGYVDLYAEKGAQYYLLKGENTITFQTFLALTLFMFRVAAANYANDTVTLDNFTVTTHFFN